LHARRLFVDVGRLCVDVGRLLVDVGRLVVDVGRLLVDVGRLVVDVGRLLVDVGRLFVDVGRPPVDAGRSLFHDRRAGVGGGATDRSSKEADARPTFDAASRPGEASAMSPSLSAPAARL